MIRKTLMEKQIAFYQEGITDALKLREQADLADQFRDQFHGEGPDKFDSVNLDMNRERVMINVRTVANPMEMLEPLRWLAKRGYRMVKEPKPDSDYVTIDWFLGKPGDEKGKIQLCAWIGGPNANCEKVQVGTEEVPVYEVKCKGEIPRSLPLPGPALVESS